MVFYAHLLCMLRRSCLEYGGSHFFVMTISPTEPCSPERSWIIHWNQYVQLDTTSLNYRPIISTLGYAIDGGIDKYKSTMIRFPESARIISKTSIPLSVCPWKDRTVLVSIRNLLCFYYVVRSVQLEMWRCDVARSNCNSLNMHSENGGMKPIVIFSTFG